VRFEIVDPASDAAVAAMMGYFGELEERFEKGFDADEALASDAEKFRPPYGTFLVGFIDETADTHPVVCGAVTALRSTVVRERALISD